jgi:aryl-alcohol dehydrogenase-like predicted oxidoreductase/CheY-like chemotaxis protein
LNAKAPQVNNGSTSENINALGSQIVREIVIPALTREVNEGKNFAQLRQVFYSLILATWYKKKIKDSILNKVYSNRKRIMGLSPTRGQVPPTRGHVAEAPIGDRNVSRAPASVRQEDPSRLPSNEGLNVEATQRNEPNDVEHIYQQYLKAFKKGVYNYIKEDSVIARSPQGDEAISERTTIPRKYFSGGVTAFINTVMTVVNRHTADSALIAELSQKPQSLMDIVGDMAMISQTPKVSAGRVMTQGHSKVRARKNLLPPVLQAIHGKRVWDKSGRELRIEVLPMRILNPVYDKYTFVIRVNALERPRHVTWRLYGMSSEILFGEKYGGPKTVGIMELTYQSFRGIPDITRKNTDFWPVAGLGVYPAVIKLLADACPLGTKIHLFNVKEEKTLKLYREDKSVMDGPISRPFKENGFELESISGPIIFEINLIKRNGPAPTKTILSREDKHLGGIDMNPAQKGRPEVSRPTKLGASIEGMDEAMLTELSQEDAAAAFEQIKARLRSKPHPVVLIVDDDRTERDLLKANISQRNPNIVFVEAVDGVQALEIIQKRKDEIDLTLSDNDMPRMNGRELFEELHRKSINIDFVLRSGRLEENKNYEGGFFERSKSTDIEQFMDDFIPDAAMLGEKFKSKQEYLYRPFGKTGLIFNLLGFGGAWTSRRWPPWRIDFPDKPKLRWVRPNREEVFKVYEEAFRLLSNKDGIVLLDSAPAYDDGEVEGGSNEQLVGDFLKAHPDLYKRAFITTKDGEDFVKPVAPGEMPRGNLFHTPLHLKEGLKRSAQRLGGRIDLLWIHFASREVLGDKAYMNAFKETREHHEYGIKYLGASFQTVDDLERAYDYQRNELMQMDAIQMKASVLYGTRPEIINDIHERGIAIFINSIGREALTNKFDVSSGRDFRGSYLKVAADPRVSMILIGSHEHTAATLNYFIQEAITLPDSAMMSTLARNSKILTTPTTRKLEKGGIDLNPAQMSMQVKKDGQDFKFNFNGTEIDAAQVTGATFTIRTMTPVTNLQEILGISR